MLLLLLGLSVIGYLFLRFSPLGAMMDGSAVLGEVESLVLMLVSLFGFMAYCMALSGVTYGILFYSGIRFYKTMYSGQGYLTHTLPVKTKELFISKLFVSGSWVFLIYLAVYASLIMLVMGWIQGCVPEVLSAAEFQELGQVLGEMGLTLGNSLFMLFLLVFVSPFSVVAQIFGCLTIGQLAKKHKVLSGILVYVGAMVVNYIVSMIGQGVVMVKAILSETGEMTMDSLLAGTYNVSLLTNLVLAIVLIIIAYRIVKNKLNLS